MHAKSYLIELANKTNTKDWLRLLIDKVITTNGNITEADFEDVYKLLINDSVNTVPQLQLFSTNSSNYKILLKKLIHHSGVCALRNEQTIKFSNNITLLWGLNGSGKSSYFKILNEIVGGNIKKDIKRNIYLDSSQPINVEISFDYQSTENTLNWNNTNRALPLLNVIRVFDSSYLKGLLNKRATDETVVNPYGLNLFSVISQYIDTLKQRLNNDILQIQVPNIEKNRLTQSLISFLEKKEYTESDKQAVAKLYDCSQDVINEITLKKQEIGIISQTDFKQKIDLFSHNKKILERLLVNIKSTINNYISEIHLVKELVYNYQILFIESANVKSSLSILSSIGNINSLSWKQFIKFGNTYTNEEVINDICPYCRQPLNQSSKDLIQAYSQFLSDESEKNLSDVEKTIKGEENKLGHTKFNFHIEKSNLNTSSDEEYIEELFLEIQKFDNFLTSQYSVLLECLNNKVFNTGLFDEIDIANSIEKIIRLYNSHIEEYKIINEEKETKLTKLTEELLPLEQNKYVSENKLLFEEWFTKIDIIKEYNKLETTISTRGITELSNKAFNELITDNLKNEFNASLQSIGLNRLSVELETAGKSKGAVNMILKLNGNDINEILSEGELKGVGLALFLAEAKLQRSNNPIILDDPVNSLDHHIAAKFANMLMDLENQIIVFTHHTLFLDAFECSKENHICKNLNGGCSKNNGKHIYLYQIQSEGKNDKGVIIPKDLNSAGSYLDRANNLLNQPTFTEYQITASYIRNAIERIIDEKIFNNQIPTKYSNKNSRINWDGLKGLNNNTQIIEKLNQFHSRMSGGDLHNGIEARENPIEKEEFQEILNELKRIIS